MIFVTHDQIEALTLADRIAVMRDRKIQQLGSPQEIYLRPANRFVATFVGSPAMSFIKGHLRTSGGPRFVADGIDIAVDTYDFAAAPLDGAAVEMGVRPEHVTLIPDDPTALPAHVELVEPMGSDLLVWTQLGGAAVTIRLPAETQVAVGDLLPLGLPGHRLNLFETVSGQRL